MTDLTFLALATVTVASAILALEARDLVYGAAALGITFLSMAGLFFLLDASYVGAFQIAVYIGAVVVLILFTVMLVGPSSASLLSNSRDSPYWPPSCYRCFWEPREPCRARPPSPGPTTAALG